MEETKCDFVENFFRPRFANIETQADMLLLAAVRIAVCNYVK